MCHPTSVFSNSPLNRLNNVRHSHTLLSAAVSPPIKSLYFIFSPTLQILLSSSDIALLPLHNLPSYSASPPSHPQIFLGISNNIAYHAIRLPQSFDVPTYLSTNPQFKFVTLFSAVSYIPHDQAAILAHARALFEFHARHQYCGLCGSPTLSDHAGSRRRCTRNIQNHEPVIPKSDNNTCNGVWFPRSDPVVIMLVLHPSQQSVLLGRATRHPKSFYSCLAGFMEHGEAIEDAVRREVLEEAGIHVGPVRFFGSQPWPFPYSLMLGCVALAEDTDITIDENELEHAKWFHRDEVAEMVRRGRLGKRDSQLAVPPPTSIAGMMCAAYIRCDPITSFASSSMSPTANML